MDISDLPPAFRDFLEGRLTTGELAAVLFRRAGSEGTGLAMDLSLFPTDVRERLIDLAPALQWEMAKLASGGAVPDVPYGSPSYHAYIAKAAHIAPEDSAD